MVKLRLIHQDGFHVVDDNEISTKIKEKIKEKIKSEFEDDNIKNFSRYEELLREESKIVQERKDLLQRLKNDFKSYLEQSYPEIQL